MTGTIFPSGVKPFSERKRPQTICLFDVDGTLSPARQVATAEMINTLHKLRDVTAIAFVGGSDLSKIKEQLEVAGDVFNNFDYCFAENGLTAYKLGKQLPEVSFINHVGEENYKKLVNYILRYLSEVDVPVKRGTFVEFRKGMINVSPIGRNASVEERNEFEKFDKQAGVRAKMVEALRKEFAGLGLTYSIGGQISFDVFPEGWDKTYALGRLEGEGFTEFHFFGDKCYKGGNDYEIYTDPRTIGHEVQSPADTIRILNELFLKDN